VCVWYVGTIDLRILSVPGAGKNCGTCVVTSRMVLWLFFESYGTFVVDSAPLVMPQGDSDLPMNVPITVRNKQTIIRRFFVRHGVCWYP
jgi:hypothetical protein